jgi:hypothetical protein
VRAITPLFSLVLLLSALSAARADWQFTRWGMTPEEVKTTSAAPNTGVTNLVIVDPSSVPLDADGAKVLLHGDYSAGHLRLRISFAFCSGGLCQVHLETADEIQGAELIGALRMKYGLPVSESRGNVTDIVWRDEPGRTIVSVLRVSGRLLT